MFSNIKLIKCISLIFIVLTIFLQTPKLSEAVLISEGTPHYFGGYTNVDCSEPYTILTLTAPENTKITELHFSIGYYEYGNWFRVGRYAVYADGEEIHNSSEFLPSNSWCTDGPFDYSFKNGVSKIEFKVLYGEFTQIGPEDSSYYKLSVDVADNATVNATKTAANNAYSAANAAKASADIATSKATLAAANTTYNNQSAAYWAYMAQNMAPTITNVQGLNYATCTTGTEFTLIISASDNGPASNLRYRVECNGYDSGWVNNSTLTITGLTTTGAKTATVKVSDNPTSPDNGNISQESLTFFKI